MTEAEVYRALSEEREDREERHMVHVHAFNALTFVADDHQHLVQGITGPARPAGNSHIHRIRVRTSFDADDGCGHWHWYDVITGPSICIGSCQHIHQFDAVTSCDANHKHEVANSTAQAPEIPRDEDEEPLPAKPKQKPLKR